MKKIKIHVIENEVIIADNLCDTLEELGYECFEPSLNYSDAVESLKTNQPDIAIIDIQLGGKKTGIDLAQHINDNYKLPFIFLTSNTDPLTINQAKKVNPYSFLTKPFIKEGIYSAIEIALNMSKKIKLLNDNKNDYLFLKDKGSFIKLYFEQICYLKSDHVYTEIFLINKTVKVFRISLNSIIDKLDDRFLRVHRSYIINCDFISEINSNTVSLCSKSIPVGAKFKLDLLKRTNNL